MNIDRRNFLRGAAVVGALGAAGALAGCAAPNAAGNDADSQREEDRVPVPDKTVQADVVIIGAGMAGLSCAVQAGINGDKVIVVESTPVVGGSGFGVEGIFGWNTRMQQEQGISFEKSLVLRAELESAHYGTDGALWEDLIDDSSANIDWLAEQGVTFSGLIDNYDVGTTAGLVPSMHWFEEGRAAVGYVPAMQARCEELGVEIITQARATELAMDGGAVKGVYAETSEGIVEFEAKAVVIASGGWTADTEKMAKYGFGPDCILNWNLSDQDGSGATMALAAGAKEFLRPCIEGNTTLPGLDFLNPLVQTLGLGGVPLWVNQDGRRFMNEDAGSVNFQLPTVTVLNQEKCFTLFNRAIAEKVLADYGSSVEELDAWIGQSPSDVWAADSISALAEAAGIDGDALVATIDEYNGFCRDGYDANFDKDPSLLVDLTEGPFYLARTYVGVDVIIGGITTDKDARVLDEQRAAIPGLYAIGVAGCMLFRDVYPIDVCSTACQNSINSGRKAALHAHGYLAESV